MTSKHVKVHYSLFLKKLLIKAKPSSRANTLKRIIHYSLKNY